MSQLMSMMGDIKRQIGTGIPSNIEDNPWREGKEHLKAIAFRSSKVLSSPEIPTLEETVDNIDEPQNNSLEMEDRPELKEKNAPAAEMGKETPKDAEFTKVPFPSRLEERQKRDEDEFVSFLNFFKTLNVNLPLMELIEKVPKYAKILKETMARHKKIKVGEQFNLSASYSVIISRQVLRKLKDPGNFTIPIEIRSIHFNRALCDLRASINLMPLSIFEKLELGNLKAIQITLQLVVKSSVHLKGVLEDVLVKVRRFPGKIVILRKTVRYQSNGRPFLDTSRSTIDLEKNELTMKINGSRNETYGQEQNGTMDGGRMLIE
ncbi:bromodomain-containing protein [Gossypium australe]|uniref:Bromodomain-containing protein n=1 Tax=Gossypium australe TaxID=47621 RepID=A0A5B6W5L9_9ROSI|nr:bromodomain-containing protein [Gossypium australe]